MKKRYKGKKRRNRTRKKERKEEGLKEKNNPSSGIISFSKGKEKQMGPHQDKKLLQG